MLALFKKDLYLFEWPDFIIIPIMAVLSAGLPLEFSFLIFALALTAPLFYHDKKKLVNRFIVSLPISKALIVRVRYLFTFITVLLFLAMQLLLHVLLFQKNIPYDWQDLWILLSLGIFLLALALPCYYYFKSFGRAIFFQWILAVIVVSFYLPLPEQEIYFRHPLIFHEWLDVNFGFLSLLVFPLLAFGLYYISMKLSTFLMRRRVC